MRALLVSGLLLVATPAFAADWAIEPGSSHIGFSGTQTGAPFKGEFKTYTATISFDPAHPEGGRVKIVIDTASAATGDPQKDEAMPGADWFAATKFPKAIFEATKFVAKGGNAYDAVGTLTIRDKTVPETLPFTLTVTGNTAHAVGRLELVRTAFGVGQGAWTSGQWVALDVGVDVDISAKKTGG